MNPFRAFLNLFRPKPGMVGVPPSARQIPADAGLHALDFAVRYAEPMDYHAAQRMTELGISTDEIGSGDLKRGIQHTAFHPFERDGGGNATGFRINVDSGIFNVDLVKGHAGHVKWSRARLRDRLDAIIAHEYEEARNVTHLEALNRAPDTWLPIRVEARRLLRAMRGDPLETIG